MQKINFQNLPNTTTPLNATNMNQLQTNVENAIADVVESGSNTNGNYIKFDNGTLIQWNSITVTDQAIDNAYGSVYQGTRTITFPIAFAGSLPSCQCSNFQYGNGASWGAVRTFDLLQMTIRGFDFFQRPTGTTCTISWFAIGKWK